MRPIAMNSNSVRSEINLACIVNRYCAESAYNERHTGIALNTLNTLDSEAEVESYDHHECHAYSILPF